MLRCRKRVLAILALLVINVCFVAFVLFSGEKNDSENKIRKLTSEQKMRTECGFVWDPELPKKDEWQTAGVDGDTFVFSAYLDNRDLELAVVRIIGINSGYKGFKRPEYCALWFRDSRAPHGLKSASVLAETLLVPETHDRKYGVVLYTCPLLDSTDTPLYVSLVRTNCDHQILNAIPLTAPPPQPASTFAICVAPFLFGYADLKTLMVFVESSLVLGADHFIFYNHNSSSVLNPFLETLVQSGIATVVDWQHLPVTVKQDPDGRAHGEFDDAPELHYFGQVAAINDCLYRNLHWNQYVVSQDLDELIVPAKESSWHAMLDQLPSSAAAYIVRNVYFPLEQVNAGPYLDDPVAEDIPAIVKMRRHTQVLEYGDRSKYFANTERVKTLGIHTIYDTLGESSGEHVVDSSVALLHHYRRVGFDVDLVHDEAALRFADAILKGYKERLGQTPK